jgi:hypothetical protein
MICSYHTRLAEVILGLEILYLCLVGAVDDSYRDGEDSVALYMLAWLRGTLGVYSLLLSP